MSTIFIGIIIFIAAAFIIRKMIKDKKSKKGCGGDCSQCGGSCPFGTGDKINPGRKN